MFLFFKLTVPFSIVQNSVLIEILFNHETLLVDSFYSNASIRLTIFPVTRTMSRTSYDWHNNTFIQKYKSEVTSVPTVRKISTWYFHFALYKFLFNYICLVQCLFKCAHIFSHITPTKTAENFHYFIPSQIPFSVVNTSYSSNETQTRPYAALNLRTYLRTPGFKCVHVSTQRSAPRVWMETHLN